MSIVNCLQPHPSTCLIASSGIDVSVKLWSPRPEVSEYYSNAFLKSPQLTSDSNQSQSLAICPET